MTLKDKAGTTIRSRKHQTTSTPRMHGTALAAFATLAMPLALHAQTTDKPQQIGRAHV